jgi:uncharacterized membrane protein
MTTEINSPPAPPDVCLIRLSHCAILAVLLAVGAGLRFHQITKVGLWPDEFWSSVHLATGRGTTLFDLPAGVLFNPPPPTLFQNAPPWWHIWTGLRGVIHPPVYLIVLRWWIDLFGSSDFSTRAFSAIASLAGIVVLFDILRRTISPLAGLFAAAFMALSPLQINLSQESRPYPLLALLGLLACHTIFRIERQGASPARLFLLALFAAATALTHYFSFGALLAIVCYAFIRLHGSNRRQTIAALSASALFVLAAWGPFLWQQRQQYFGPQPWSFEASSTFFTPWIRSAAIPSALLYGRVENTLNWLAPAIIAYLLPLFLLRRYPQILLWWLWIVGIVGSLILYDSIHHGRLLGTVRYLSLASVALYAICAVPIPLLKSWRWAVACLVLASLAIAAIQRVQEGPPDFNGDWRGLAVTVDQQAGPDDALIFYPTSIWGSPGMYYLAFSHYARTSHRPVMYLTAPANPAVLRQLNQFKRVWLVGPTVTMDVSTYLPGWTPVFSRGFPNSGSFTEMKRDNSRTTSPSPWHPKTP